LNQKWFSFALVGVALTACNTTERFAPSVDQVATATTRINTEIEALLKPDFASAEAEATRQAALNNDLWVLSPECLQLAEVSATPGLARCDIQKTPFGDQPASPNLASDTARKSRVLTDYVEALGVLSNADSEDELFAALAVANVSFSEFGRASDSAALKSFVADIDAQSDKIESAGRKAFDALRYRKLKDVVTKRDADVSALVSEIQIGLLALGKDGAFLSRSLRLQQANANAQALRGQGAAAVAAYQELQAAQADFVDNYDRSLIGRVGLVAQAHNGLAAGLRNPDSPEEIVSYLEALRRLANDVGS
jgi:hypothetical protein